LISWKNSFKKLNEEYEIAKKKKQALDKLLDSGKISQSTHELVSMEIEEALIEIEKQQKALLEKMNSKMMELEGQIKTLEMLLANSEIRHVTGEVDEEVYQRESSLLSMGLETARQELDLMRDAVKQLSQVDVVVLEEIKLQSNKNDVSEAKIEAAEATKTGSDEASQEQLQEVSQNVEQQESAENIAKSEEKPITQ
jgi:hypothetical protein